MPDPVVAGAAALFVTGAARRVLGPPADEVGKALARITENRLQNVGRIAEKAEAKLGDRAELPGTVPLRVAAKVLEGGSWCDDDVMQEYLAGVLAGSRSADGADDRGAYWADLVARLAGDYVRVHYLLYRALHDHGAAADGPSIALLEGQQARSVYLPVSGMAASLGVTVEEASSIGNNSLHVLARESLIAPTGWGNGVHVLEHVPGATEPGVHAVPSHAGMELFMWAQGVAPSSALDILKPRPEVSLFDEHLVPVEGAVVGRLL